MEQNKAHGAKKKKTTFTVVDQETNGNHLPNS
jgi:hypothetical protein